MEAGHQHMSPDPLVTKITLGHWHMMPQDIKDARLPYEYETGKSVSVNDERG